MELIIVASTAVQAAQKTRLAKVKNADRARTHAKPHTLIRMYCYVRGIVAFARRI